MDIERDLNEIMDNLSKRLSNAMKSSLEKSINQPCKIHIDKNRKGIGKVDIRGSRGAILTTLAGVKKDILTKLNCTDTEFKMIESVIGTKEADSNE